MCLEVEEQTQPKNDNIEDKILSLNDEQKKDLFENYVKLIFKFP